MLNKIFKDYSASTKVIIAEALRREIKTKPIDYRHILELKYKNHKEYLFNQILLTSSLISSEIINNKYITKLFLKANDISVPEGKQFFSKQNKSVLKYAKFLGWPVVIKPISSSHGTGVILNIKNTKDFLKYWEYSKKRYSTLLVEKQFAGDEYRILATKNKVLGIINRVPANVRGDGRHTLKQLIGIKNKDPRRAENFRKGSLVKIRFNKIELENLKKHNIFLDEVIPLNNQIFLKNNSNISTGGDSFDATDIAHPSIKKIAVKVIKSIPGLQYAGIDLMTKDITKEQTDHSYTIIEVNDSPGIDIHHFPYQGKSRNIAKELIDMLFPETKSK
jgi:D-alanine-D-alanine ligase-like ATP-grasp enzyme